MTNFETLKSLLIKERIKPGMQEMLDSELYYLECNEADVQYLLKAKDTLKINNAKTENPNNSLIVYLLGMTDNSPSKSISKTATTLPDIDYDTDARDPIKAYLVEKYGSDKVCLLGTYNTLKVKGAIKDVVRQIEPDMSFDEVNKITKKFDLLKRTDFKTEIEFYEATLGADKELKKWLDAKPAIAEAVQQLLGNAKSTGVHAGGIVVSSTDIKRVVPLTYERNEDIWVTQPEMADVEGAGLIKYDFLGLNTLADLNRCMKLVNKRHGTKFTLSNIPLEDPAILNEFQKGNTISVFQFSTPLATALLMKLKSIDSINDLALVTSIARPGPLNMGMDVTFVKRKNGDEPIVYDHPALETVLKDTYGIFVYQEQIMLVVRQLGGLTGDESLTVMKAMGKKDKAKLVKFKDRFLSVAQKTHGVKPEVAQRVWDLMESFAEYGFNRSHAIAYACVSYLCMWFKEKYPLEWIAGVLDGADKDDFKTMYLQWSEKIQRPDINYSKNTYYINDKHQNVVMPFSGINGVGDKAVEVIVKIQPFESFEEFFKKIDKRKVNKGVVLNLVFSGSFDRFKPADMSENKWRKTLVKKFIELRHKDKKPPKLEREQDEILLREVDSMTRGKILMKEIGLLNFTAFDYHTYYKDKMTVDAKRLFGKEAMKPQDIFGFKDKTEVVIGGAIESIDFVPIKSGKFMGQERAIIRLTNAGGAVEVIIWPWTLEQDDKAGGGLRALVELTPLIIKGTVNVWNDKFSVVFKEGIVLA